MYYEPHEMYELENNNSVDNYYKRRRAAAIGTPGREIQSVVRWGGGREGINPLDGPD
jgi:hypothetical protein